MGTQRKQKKKVLKKGMWVRGRVCEGKRETEKKNDV